MTLVKKCKNVTEALEYAYLPNLTHISNLGNSLEHIFRSVTGDKGILKNVHLDLLPCLSSFKIHTYNYTYLCS